MLLVEAVGFKKNGLLANQVLQQLAAQPLAPYYTDMRKWVNKGTTSVDF